jgi:hypothetical protein
MLSAQLVALRPQPRDDAPEIDQRLGSAERNEADLRSGGAALVGGRGTHAERELVAIGAQIKVTG